MSQPAETYHTIAKAIQYLDENFKTHPQLKAIAAHVDMSEFHFQRLFKSWVGISPKKYLQYLSVSFAKSQLEDAKHTLFDTAIETGLSGTGRLHDLFISIEGMTPGTYRNGGKNLTINYSIEESPFGSILLAATPKGICHIAFTNDKKQDLLTLKTQFPKATFHEKSDQFQENALLIFKDDWRKLPQIKLHLKGTDFQLKVWEALLSIPQGKLTTYGHIAKAIHHPKASRAVGTAIGHNPIAYLIPCHRVIQSSGQTGGYRWHPIRKKAIIGWDTAKASL